MGQDRLQQVSLYRFDSGKPASPYITDLFLFVEYGLISICLIPGDGNQIGFAKVRVP